MASNGLSLSILVHQRRWLDGIIPPKTVNQWSKRHARQSDGALHGAAGRRPAGRRDGGATYPNAASIFFPSSSAAASSFGSSAAAST